MHEKFANLNSKMCSEAYGIEGADLMSFRKLAGKQSKHSYHRERGQIGVDLFVIGINLYRLAYEKNAPAGNNLSHLVDVGQANK